jgi:hypothetical protein
MQLAMPLLMYAGFALWIIGSVWFLYLVFRISIGWGLACTFIPCMAFVFVFQHWSETGKPFLMMLGGLVLFAVMASVILPRPF